MSTGYVSNIEEIVVKNDHFREVLYTGKYCQLVVMMLKPGEDIPLETHPSVDQFFRIESGTAKIIMNGEENILTDGMVAIIPAGVAHHVINMGEDSLRLYTIYSPANHPEHTIHHTLADAMAAEATEHATV